MSKVVTSTANSDVKFLASLRLRKNRDEHGLFLAEGERTALQGLQQGVAPRYLAYVPGNAESESVQHLRDACLCAGGTCLEVTEAIIAKITHKANPQAILAAFPTDLRPIAEIKPSTTALYVVLDRIRDPGNLGTVIRTADCVAASGILLVGDCCDPFSVETVRATMGSIFSVPICQCSELEFAELAASWPGSVVGTSPTAIGDYRDVTARDPVLAVIGNEQVGMSESVAKACTQIVRIPIFGNAESLNLGVAAGILLYAIRLADGRAAEDV
jgi:TrmH family RNA methyltransferase